MIRMHKAHTTEAQEMKTTLPVKSGGWWLEIFDSCTGLLNTKGYQGYLWCHGQVFSSSRKDQRVYTPDAFCCFSFTGCRAFSLHQVDWKPLVFSLGEGKLRNVEEANMRQSIRIHN